MAALDTVNILLVCPECGNSTWIRRENGDFECLSCGDIYDEKDMRSMVEPIECGF